MDSGERDLSEGERSDSDERYSDATGDLPPEGLVEDITAPDVEDTIRDHKEDQELSQDFINLDESKSTEEFAEKLAGTEIEDKNVDLEELKDKLKQLDEGKCHLCRYYYTIGDEKLIVHGT